MGGVERDVRQDARPRAHLVGLSDAKVVVTLEIEAHLPSGASEQTVRVVTENGKTLKFKTQAFESE